MKYILKKISSFVFDFFAKADGAQFPHCDPRVLHQKGLCEYCDEYPHYQGLRIAWGINFTGIMNEHLANDFNWKLLPCPSDFNRGTGGAHVWPGNTPRRHDRESDDLPSQPWRRRG
jgi:hypothetical protein